LSKFKKSSPLWKPEIELFRHFPKLKIAYLMEKILSISLKLNCTPNTLGCYGLSNEMGHLTFIPETLGVRVENTENVRQSVG